MSKERAQTIQQKFGFLDDDLTQDAHDEIILWLDQNIGYLLPSLIKSKPEWQYEDINLSTSARLYPTKREGAIREFLKRTDLPQKPLVGIEKKIWEYPITTQQSKGYGNKYTVGFADMCIVCNRPALSYDIDNDTIKITKGSSFHAFFEAKSYIKSLGELIRQIRLYQEYTKGIWFVIAPDDRFSSQLNQQGIGFIKYEK